MAITKKNGGNGHGGGKKPNGKEPTVKEMVATLVVDMRSVKSDVSNLKKGLAHLRRSFDERITRCEAALGLRAEE